MMPRPKLVRMPVNMTIRAEVGMARAFRRLASVRGVSTGAVLREALNRYLNLKTVQKELGE